MTREQRLVFGEAAETYDCARPGFPDGMVDAVAAFAALGDGARVLDVGCGTGKATVPFAARIGRAIGDAGGTKPVEYTVELFMARKVG